MIHTVKGFGIVNEAEVDSLLEFSCFFHDPMDVGNLISGSSAFSKTSLNIRNFMVHILLKPSLENLEHYFTSMWDESNCAVVWAFEYSLALPFFEIGMKTDIFNQQCWRSWSWTVLWRPRRPFRTNTQKICPFHSRGLECKSRKSRDTWSNGQIWPWSTKWNRQRLTEFCQENTLVIVNTLFQQHKRRLYTWPSPDGQHQNQIDYFLCSWGWRNSI